MNGDVIKSFLVGLGFGVDDASLAKFNAAITSATLRVTALYGSINAVASGIFFSISKISESFEDLGYQYKILAPAINKALILRQEMFKAYSAAGVNLTKVVQQSLKLNISLTKTKYAFEAIYKSVASKFFDILTKKSDLFRKKLYDNLPKIQERLEKFIKIIFKAFEAINELGLRVWSILGRVYDFFVALDKATDGWSTIILGVIAAWKLLNLSFLATPLGLIITGLTAILALFDDFKTWQEGGKSLFDWTSFIPTINAVKKTLEDFWGILKSIGETLGNLAAAVVLLFQGNFLAALEALKAAGFSVLGIFSKIWDTVKGLLFSIAKFGEWGRHFFDTSAKIAPVLGPISPGVPQVNPIGNNTANNSQTNQNVQQQTNINIQGVSDATAVGKAVSGEQNRVNFDLVRNLKGSIR